MKKAALFLLSLAFLNCTDKQMSHTETAKVVVESFYKKDNSKLKSHTTPESYESFLAVQDFMTAEEAGASNYKVLEETVDGDKAWVKFTISYEEKPETFKLVKDDGQWKVDEKGVRERAPF
ncbi:DUF4878 domain-containing protein [Subsaxibacter sp. CAU 1640]|uniref:DUF4878 domain-containing protein n=1 Tax=Subsaxibacter sp. CAU 1640 TaxID=2933271 RepID=UPI00200323B7|nr:DUF4878 domain-containing protein [Subsaxibacter sp. CAU 1640]MCK7591328.1 DUF4878 domain-containing protein [Subsaxibacter sp. CAU 1640]